MSISQNISRVVDQNLVHLLLGHSSGQHLGDCHGQDMLVAMASIFFLE